MMPPQQRVSVLIPARNESVRIGTCLAAVRAQQPGDQVEIIILDDESVDDTGLIAAAAADGDARVRILDGAPLPEGWLGKPHACWQLAAAADPASDVLVFLDADVLLQRHAIAAGLELLERAGLDFVAPYPRQVVGSVAERLVQPLLQWSWLTFLPLRIAESAPRPSLAVANGQFLIVRRAAYERAGGHFVVRRFVLDDIELARALRHTGAHGGLVDGTHLAACRMYHGWQELREGYSKSLWAAFGSPAGAAAAMLLLNVAYVIPAVAALFRSRAGLAGYLAATLGRVISARVTGGRLWPDVLAHPASVLAMTLLMARSVSRHRRGTLTWKLRPIRQMG
jgi:glycosyltransferase involved in cell wall biosynthesis